MPDQNDSREPPIGDEHPGAGNRISDEIVDGDRRQIDFLKIVAEHSLVVTH